MVGNLPPTSFSQRERGTLFLYCRASMPSVYFAAARKGHRAKACPGKPACNTSLTSLRTPREVVSMQAVEL